MKEYLTHSINPLAIDWGWLVLPWYWLMYFLGFLWILWSTHHLRKKCEIDLSAKDLSHYLQWGWISMFLGARVVYILFYNLDFFIKNPSYIPKIWLGGMSFHGALLGVAISIFIVAKKKAQNFYLFADPLAVAAPFVLIFGRIANFINGELVGRITDVPWAVVFPRFGTSPRHPSQIYEALTEGLLTFIILWAFKKKMKTHPGLLSSLFLILYGAFRFLVEFYRQPDPQLGTIIAGLSMGQLMCLVMVMIGSFLMFLAKGSWITNQNHATQD
ncbi:MAG: prolipoprotein diacylglyceryl transferase [Deltaproteobacteria bacterium]|nr:MAG: prolipoprotein diacylglyceryl transferase [Deltaproteobacteria bacterium]TNF25838.1 MAG: prolipoprotein diacylglyceryl transferase [Deltaproteobacteria bacterium]